MTKLLDLFTVNILPGLMHWGVRLGTALLILALGLYLSKRLSYLVGRGVERRGGDAVLVSFLRRGIFIALTVLVVIGALDRTGVPTASFLAALGAAGLAIGLALKDSLGNLASGVLLVATRPFRAGDQVEAGGKQGQVERIDLLQTVLVTADNIVVSVPNAQVMSQPIVNFTARGTRRLDLAVVIAYDGDPQRAQQTIQAVVDAHPGVLRDPPSQILVQRLGDNGIAFAVRPWVRTGELLNVQSDLLGGIKAALETAGIAMAQPARGAARLTGPDSANNRRERSPGDTDPV